MITEEQFERLKKYLNEECLPAGSDTKMVQKVYSERLLSAIHGALVKKMDDNLSAWQLTLTEIRQQGSKRITLLERIAFLSYWALALTLWETSLKNRGVYGDIQILLGISVVLPCKAHQRTFDNFTRSSLFCGQQFTDTASLEVRYSELCDMKEKLLDLLTRIIMSCPDDISNLANLSQQAVLLDKMFTFKVKEFYLALTQASVSTKSFL
ncbi:MAG: hypothetical protein JNN26_21455 [Candidatus Obscuribacter sp.]|nr:hypothetical protein [Candidatus Obscuribacter sp.]